MTNILAAVRLEAYKRALEEGDSARCLYIEGQAELDGYPPELVCVGLVAMLHDKDPHEAIQACLNEGG